MCQQSWSHNPLLCKTCCFFPSSCQDHQQYLLCLPMEDGQAELAWVARYIPGWFIHPMMVIPPSNNWDRHSLTLLIETNMLPFSQTTNQLTYLMKPIIQTLKFTKKHAQEFTIYRVACHLLKLLAGYHYLTSISWINQNVGRCPTR